MNQRITVGNYSLAWNDAWLCIEVNGYDIYLTPTQYRICRAFLSASDAKAGLVVGTFAILSYQSCDELLEMTKLLQSGLVKHISNLNARLAAIGLTLCSFQEGYLLTLSAKLAQTVRQRDEKRKDF